MDEITKEVITSALKRIAKLEKDFEDVRKFLSVQKIKPILIPDRNKTNLATEIQIKYIRTLGGELDRPETLTKEHAGEMIDNLLKDKKIKKTSKAIVEPEEVDTEDAGLEGELL